MAKQNEATTRRKRGVIITYTTRGITLKTERLIVFNITLRKRTTKSLKTQSTTEHNATKAPAAKTTFPIYDEVAATTTSDSSSLSATSKASTVGVAAPETSGATTADNVAATTAIASQSTVAATTASSQATSKNNAADSQETTAAATTAAAGETTTQTGSTDTEVSCTMLDSFLWDNHNHINFNFKKS